MFGFGKRENTVKARIEELRPGHYIELEGRWLTHNFLRSKFVIDSPHVIDELREAGFETVLVHPDRSLLPFPATPEAASPADTLPGSGRPSTTGVHSSPTPRKITTRSRGTPSTITTRSPTARRTTSGAPPP